MQHTFYVHFFAVVLYGSNEKRPNYTFYGGNVVFIFSCFPSNKIDPFCSVFISLFSSLSVFHVNVDIKIKSKERIGSVFVYL